MKGCLGPVNNISDDIRMKKTWHRPPPSLKSCGHFLSFFEMLIVVTVVVCRSSDYIMWLISGSKKRLGLGLGAVQTQFLLLLLIHILGK